MKIIALIPVILLTACAHLNPGADPLLVRAEQGQVDAKATIDLVLHTEASNYGFWRTNAPGFYQFCEIQLKAPTTIQTASGPTNVARSIAYLWQVDQAKLAYKAARSASNSNQLYSILVGLSLLANDSMAWMINATNSVNKPR